ncbi:MAG: glutaminyl-peptide cyclotransferase [Planctomycetota bacterium]|jgi:glutaminyl-peptide cyclotransferase
MGLVPHPVAAMITPMSHTTARIAAFGASLLLLASCQGDTAASIAQPREMPAFDAHRSWQLLLDQVALGPRPSGSEANAQLRELIVKDLEASGLKPQRQAFVAKDAPGGPITMENVFADFEGQAGKKGELAPIVILAAHFDTKLMDFTFLGANDGASEVAVLLELARGLASGPQLDVTYRFVFLDGEEAVRLDWEDPDNRYGSRHNVKEITKKKGELKRVRAMILIDMVGDKDLQLERDSNSNRTLMEIFVKTSVELKMPELFAPYPIPILDDHQSYSAFGVPSLDLIDLHYGEFGNEYWHTDQDVALNCSKESLAKVGKLVLHALPAVEAQFCQNR